MEFYWDAISYSEVIALRLPKFQGCNDQESIQSSQHLTQDSNGKVTNSQYDTTNESQEVSHIPTGDHRLTQRHSKYKTEKNSKDPKS